MCDLLFLTKWAIFNYNSAVTLGADLLYYFTRLRGDSHYPLGSTPAAARRETARLQLFSYRLGGGLTPLAEAMICHSLPLLQLPMLS
jgi:hypothetical protein